MDLDLWLIVLVGVVAAFTVMLVIGVAMVGVAAAALLAAYAFYLTTENSRRRLDIGAKLTRVLSKPRTGAGEDGDGADSLLRPPDIEGKKIQDDSRWRMS